MDLILPVNGELSFETSSPKTNVPALTKAIVSAFTPVKKVEILPSEALTFRMT